MKKVLIIAEAGVNHNGSLKLAKKLIEVAKNCGADCVKFQLFKSENLVQNMGADESSQFIKKDIAGIKNIKVTNEIHEFQSKIYEFDKSEFSTNSYHYKITWKRVIILFLLNFKAMLFPK